MTSRQKEVIKKIIQKEIETLKRSVTMLTELADSELQSDANDWFSSKDSNASKDINDQALAKSKQRIMIMTKLLNKIESEGFGLCSKCKSEIPFERMKAMPTASRCMDC